MLLVRLLILAVGIAALVGGAASAISAMRLLRRRQLVRRRRRRLKVLLVVGGIVAAYLSVGLVWSSDTIRVYGCPMPMVAFERQPSGQWFDFVSPFSVVAPFGNFAFWLGLAVAPVTLPEWRRRRTARKRAA